MPIGGELHPVGTLVDLTLHKGGTVLNHAYNQLLLVSCGLLLLLFIALCAGFAQLSVTGQTIGY